MYTMNKSATVRRWTTVTGSQIYAQFVCVRVGVCFLLVFFFKYTIFVHICSYTLRINNGIMHENVNTRK